MTKPNTNTMVMSVCSFVVLCSIGWVGRTASETHDAVIELKTKQQHVEADVAAINLKMLTRADLSIELLKLQIPAGKAAIISTEIAPIK